MIGRMGAVERSLLYRHQALRPTTVLRSALLDHLSVTPITHANKCCGFRCTAVSSRVTKLLWERLGDRLFTVPSLRIRTDFAGSVGYLLKDRVTGWPCRPSLDTKCTYGMRAFPEDLIGADADPLCKRCVVVRHRRRRFDVAGIVE